MIFLADDEQGRSCYINAPTWAAAERMCEAEDLTLVGEYISSEDWATKGDTMQ